MTFSVKNLEKTIHVCNCSSERGYRRGNVLQHSGTLLPESRRGWKMLRFEKQKRMTSSDFCDKFMESGFSPVDK